MRRHQRVHTKRWARPWCTAARDGPLERAARSLAIRDLAGAIREYGNKHLTTLDFARLRPRDPPEGTAVTAGIALEASGFDEATNHANVALDYAPLGDVDGFFNRKHGRIRSLRLVGPSGCRTQVCGSMAHQQRESK